MTLDTIDHHRKRIEATIMAAMRTGQLAECEAAFDNAPALNREPGPEPLYLCLDYLLCRACVLEHDSGARFEGDDQSDWEERPAGETPRFFGTFYRQAGVGVCDGVRLGGCMGGDQQ